MINARAYAASCIINGYALFITGGEATELTTEYIVSGITANPHAWHDMPTPSSGGEYRYHTMVRIDEILIAFVCGDFFNGNYLYNMHSHAYTPLANMATTRRGCSAGKRVMYISLAT